MRAGTAAALVATAALSVSSWGMTACPASAATLPMRVTTMPKACPAKSLVASALKQKITATSSLGAGGKYLNCSYTTAAGEASVIFSFPYPAAAFSKTRSVALESGAVAVKVGDQAYVIKSANELLALSGKLEMVISAPKAGVAQLVALGKAILG